MSESSAKKIRRLSNRAASKTAQEMLEWAQHAGKAINTLDEAVGLHSKRIDDVGRLARSVDERLGRLQLTFGVGFLLNVAVGVCLLWAAV